MNCAKCGTPFVKRYNRKKFCSRRCAGLASADAKRGKGRGWRIDTLGYVRGTFRGTPEHDKLLHRIAMEKSLGRELRPGETVHHRFGDRTDFDARNLELWAKRHPPGQRVSDLDIWSGTIPAYQHGAL
jgi:hypothetical protein